MQPDQILKTHLGIETLDYTATPCRFYVTAIPALAFKWPGRRIPVQIQLGDVAKARDLLVHYRHHDEASRLTRLMEAATEAMGQPRAARQIVL